MAKKTSTKNKDILKGTNAADVLTIKHSQVTVNAGKGNDKINVNSGSKHKIYGEAGKDTITVGAKAGTGMKVYGDDAKGKVTGNDTFKINGGKKNYFYGGKGVDTFNVNAGTTNYIYGGAGNDVIAIGKTSTGTAVVKDFSVSKNNTDKIRVLGAAVKNIAVSGKNMIVKGGKSASLTLQNAKAKTFTVSDILGNYTVSGSNIKLTLSKNFKGTLNAASFITTIDARNVANVITINANARNNIIFTGKSGGTYSGGAANDTINVGGTGQNTVYGNDGNDAIIVKGGSDNTVYGNAGDDTIKIYNKGTFHGNLGADKINIFSGQYVYVYGDEGADVIVIEKGADKNVTVRGGGGSDIITIKGGNGNKIYGDVGDDIIEITNTVGNGNKIYGGEGVDSIKVNGGTEEIYGDKGNDRITINSGENHIVEGDGGNDIITVNGGNGHKIYTSTTPYSKSSDQSSDTAGGKNTVEINGSANDGYGIYVEGGVADDTLVIKGYDGNASDLGVTAELGYGDDVVEIYGGMHKIELGGGDDKVTIVGGNNIEITKAGGLSGKDTFTFDNSFGEESLSFKINIRDTYSKDDIIFTKVASTDVTFRCSSASVIDPGSESSLYIDIGNSVVEVAGWFSFGSTNRLNNVSFSDGVTLTRSEINSLRNH